MTSSSMNGKVYAQQRLQRFEAMLQEQGIDAAIVSNPLSVHYFSGFNPIIQSTPVFVVVVPGKGRILLVHSLRAHHARSASWIDDVELYGSWGGRKTLAASPLEALRLLLADAGAKRIGIEEQALTVAAHRALTDMVAAEAWVDVSPAIGRMRQVKDPYEADLIRKAARVADAGMEAAVAAIRPGVTEGQVATASVRAMHDLWLREFPHLEPVDFAGPETGIFNAFFAYCLTGERMNMMCDAPSNTRIADGDFVLVVVWAALEGYHAENERTVAVGRISPRQEALYETTLLAREKAFAALRPGVPAAEVYKAATDVMVEAGYGHVLPGRIGHGIGLGAHEEPSIAPTSNALLVPGMTFTIEPALRIGAEGGVQHSDTVVMTDSGWEFLTKTDRGKLVAS